MNDEKRENLIKRLQAILKRNPNCVWAKNELRYLDVRKMPGYAVIVSAGAYRADNTYHGGYTE